MTIDKSLPNNGAENLIRKEVYDPTKPFNEMIRSLIASTHQDGWPMQVKQFGKRFVMIEDSDYWRGYSRMHSNDGIGTKGWLHWLMRTEEHGVHDAFAMVVDDLIESGHVPVYLLDHLQMQEEDGGRIFKIAKELTDLAVSNPWQTANGQMRPIIIAGGETAIINTLKGFELGITATGFVKHSREIRANIREGDMIVGVWSNGVHSNGLSFLREEFSEKKHMALEDRLPWGRTIGEELTAPTHIYLPAIKELIERMDMVAGSANKVIHGMVHITGGGLSKLRELLPRSKDLDIEVGAWNSLPAMNIFRYVQSEFCVPSSEMYKRFNNGIGYVVAMDSKYAHEAAKVIGNRFRVEMIGFVVKGSGKVRIESAYEKKTVEY